MDARTVGLRLVELTTLGQDAKVLDELYADDVISIEFLSDSLGNPTVAGLQLYGKTR